jgi:hypothetical protein
VISNSPPAIKGLPHRPMPLSPDGECPSLNPPGRLPSRFRATLRLPLASRRTQLFKSALSPSSRPRLARRYPSPVMMIPSSRPPRRRHSGRPIPTPPRFPGKANRRKKTHSANQDGRSESWKIGCSCGLPNRRGLTHFVEAGAPATRAERAGAPLRHTVLPWYPGSWRAAMPRGDPLRPAGAVRWERGGSAARLGRARAIPFE